MKSYLDEYKSKLITAEKAAAMVKSGDIINYGAFNLKPVDYDIALGNRAGEPGLEKVYIKLSGQVLPMPQVLVKDPEMKTFQCMSWFWSALDRYFGDKGQLDFGPLNYHDTNQMSYAEDRTPPSRRGDYWVAQVAPMDKHGNFNIGITNTDALQKCLASPISIVEVNNTIPRCLGGYEESVHISQINYIIESSNYPLMESGAIPDPSPEEKRIAELIMEEITDGCCLQLGIGAMPDTIGKMIAKSDLKDMGIQTEMFCPSMVDMYEAGKITNAKKNVDKYKSTYSFSLGTRDTYDFIDNNPRLASCPVEYVNAPQRVCLQDKIISINNLLEIDLLTQACSESDGLRQISGSGGQLDWVHGAFDSKGGKSFLAFTSTHKNKKGEIISRVKPMLTPGAAVTVPRHSIHWVVTEYGKVALKGLSQWERVEELIKIAHPDFRDDLLKEAAQMGIWHRTNRRPL
jgi:acyl-CoA hydrolase